MLLESNYDKKKNDVYTILNFQSFYIFTKVKDSVEVSEL